MSKVSRIPNGLSLSIKILSGSKYFYIYSSRCGNHICCPYPDFHPFSVAVKVIVSFLLDCCIVFLNCLTCLSFNIRLRLTLWYLQTFLFWCCLANLYFCSLGSATIFFFLCTRGVVFYTRNVGDNVICLSMWFSKTKTRAQCICEKDGICRHYWTFHT